MDHKRPIICIDFDGTCSDYSYGWQGIDVINDTPVEGLWDKLLEYHQHCDIYIFSSRSCEYRGIEAMQNWFTRNAPWLYVVHAGYDYLVWFNGVDVFLKLYFPKDKPPAHYTLDDRAQQFTGIFPSVEKILNFKPWHKIKNVFPKE